MLVPLIIFAALMWIYVVIWFTVYEYKNANNTSTLNLRRMTIRVASSCIDISLLLIEAIIVTLAFYTFVVSYLDLLTLGSLAFMDSYTAITCVYISILTFIIHNEIRMRLKLMRDSSH